MEWNALFFLNSALLGAALAMDAFSVSMANGLARSSMTRREEWLIAGTFSFFQFLMPLAGWLMVHTLMEVFDFLTGVIPWAALALLGFLGVRMIREGIAERKNPSRGSREEQRPLSRGVLATQGLATSMDALSAGLATGEYGPAAAIVSSVIIALVTLGLCLFGVRLGRRAGEAFSGRTTVLGGCVLIVIGLEILIKSFL